MGLCSQPSTPHSPLVPHLFPHRSAIELDMARIDNAHNARGNAFVLSYELEAEYHYEYILLLDEIRCEPLCVWANADGSSWESPRRRRGADAKNNSAQFAPPGRRFLQRCGMMPGENSADESRQNDATYVETGAAESTQKADSSFGLSPRAWGLIFGVISGFAWGFDTVLLNKVYETDVYLQPLDSFASGAIPTFCHDMVSAALMLVFVGSQGLYPALLSAFNDRGVLWMIFAGICGAPLGMTGYLLSITYIGSGYAAAISAL